MNQTVNRLIITGLLIISGPASAHHSFAVHYVPDRIISVSGMVTEFRFTNPHGLIMLTVKSDTGEEQSWRAETNSPNVLRRRGWTKHSIKAGDLVTIEGYPSRDGSYNLRVHKVILPGGGILPGQGTVLADPPVEK
jgi:hypothetical protein